MICKNKNKRYNEKGIKHIHIISLPRFTYETNQMNITARHLVIDKIAPVVFTANKIRPWEAICVQIKIKHAEGAL